MDDTEVSKYAGLYAMSDPTTAVAVAIAEHGGGNVSATAVGHNDDGSIDVGMWQINSVHRRTHPTWTEAWLKDPKNNAEAMSVVSSGGSNWQPWTTYRNGKYKNYLDRAQKAREATSGSGGLGSIPNPLEAVDNVGEFLSAIIDPIKKTAEWLGDPHNWVRIIQVAGGIALGIAAASLVLRPYYEDAQKLVPKGIL